MLPRRIPCRRPRDHDEVQASLPRRRGQRHHLVAVAKDKDADRGEGDQVILDLALTRDETFASLYEGDTKGYKNTAAARDAFMASLAFWSRRDADAMVRIYEGSKLFSNEGRERVTAMAKKACDRAKMVFDDEFGSAPAYIQAGTFRRPSIRFWDESGHVVHSLLAHAIRKDLFARTIDGAAAYWDGRWILGRRAIEQATFLFTEAIGQKGRKEVAHYVRDNAYLTPGTNSGMDYDGRVYVQFDNCTCRVGADEVVRVEPTPDMLVVGRLPVDYDDPGPNAADEFLDQITCGDRNVRAVLEEVIGACMTASHVVSKSIVLQGCSGAGAALDASNGKSTFVNLLKAMLGDANVTCISPEALGGRFQSATLIGKLAVLADDINPGALSQRRNSTFKQVVSGNSIHTDIKNQDGCDFKPLATVIMSLNGNLEIEDMDDGLKRRLLFVPFRAQFTEGTDSCRANLADDLSHDPLVLRRLACLGLRGLQRLVKRRRYTHIPGSERMLNEVARTGEPVASWVHYAEIDYMRNVHERTTTEVYNLFRDWCDQQGWEQIPNAQVFSRKLAKNKEFVRTISEAIFVGRVEAPDRWRLATFSEWDPMRHKSVRRYCLRVA